MNVVFQCSLNKDNRLIEKAILVEAGLITDMLDNTWLRFRKGYNGYILTAERSYTNNLNLIVTANQFVTIVLMQKINHAFTDRDLIKCIKLTQRNKNALRHTQYQDLI